MEVQRNTDGDTPSKVIVEKTKRKNIIELQYCTGMSRREIKNKIEKKSLLFFFQFSKNWVGRVGKTKNEKTLALLRIYHEFKGRIDKSVPRVTVWHHEAAPSGAKPEGQIYLSFPQTHDGFCTL